MWGEISINPKLNFYSTSSEEESPWILSEEELSIFIDDSYSQFEHEQIIAGIKKFFKRKKKDFKKWYFKEYKKYVRRVATVKLIVAEAKIIPLSHSKKAKPNPSWKTTRIRKQYEINKQYEKRA